MLKWKYNNYTTSIGKQTKYWQLFKELDFVVSKRIGRTYFVEYNESPSDWGFKVAKLFATIGLQIGDKDLTSPNH